MVHTTTFIIALLLCTALTIALPVRNNLITSETLATRIDSIKDEVRSLDDFELEDLAQRGGTKQIAQKVIAKVQGLGAKLSPSQWSEKRKERKRQKATMEGLVREHANHVAWQNSVKAKESVQRAQYQSARVAQKKEKMQAMQQATSRRKTWSPGQGPNGLPGKLGFAR